MGLALQWMEVSVVTIARLRELFQYDHGTGALTWAGRPARCIRIGMAAGCLDSDGYRVVGLDGKLYKAHRIIFAMQTGEWPKHEVDHRNGVRSDNAWANLRTATSAENKQNKQRAQANNRTGYLGVCFIPKRRHFRAQITIAGKCKHIGSFPTAEAAHAAYLDEKRRHHAGCTI